MAVALIAARSSDKPTFLNIRTVIGFGAHNAGTAEVHGAALGVDEVANLKRSFGLDPNEHFHIPGDVYDFFRDIPGRGKTHEANWEAVVTKHRIKNPVLGAEFALRVAGKMSDDWSKLIPCKEEQPTSPTASRKSAGVVTNALAGNLNSFLVGTADLTPSCNVAYKSKVDFQSVSTDITLLSLPFLQSPVTNITARSSNCMRPGRRLQRSVCSLRYSRACHVRDHQRAFRIQQRNIHPYDKYILCLSLVCRGRRADGRTPRSPANSHCHP